MEAAANGDIPITFTESSNPFFQLQYNGSAGSSPSNLFKIRSSSNGTSIDTDLMTFTQGGNIGIGSTSANATLQIYSNNGSTLRMDANNNQNSSILFTENNSSFFRLLYDAAAGSSPNNLFQIQSSSTNTDTWDVNDFTITQGGSIGIGLSGQNTPLAKTGLDIEKNSLGNSTLVANNSGGAGDIFTASSAGTPKFLIDKNGNIGFTGNTSFVTTLNSAATAARAITLPDAAGTVCLSGQTCATSGTVGYWQRVNNVTSGFNYLSPSTIADTFSLGVNGSGANIVPYSGLYIESNSFNTKGNAMVALNQTGNGDIFTASSSGAAKFSIDSSGDVKMGTTSAAALIHIRGDGSSSKPSLELDNSTEDIGYAVGDNLQFGTWDGATWTERMRLSSGGSLLVGTTSAVSRITAVTQSGNSGDLNGFTFLSGGSRGDAVVTLSQGFSGLDRSGVQYQINNAPGWYSGIPYKCGNPANLFIIGQQNYIDNCSLTSTANIAIKTNGNVGINTNTPLATLDVRGNIGTSPVASISGATSFAGLVVDNSGVGDIFTASSSGLNRFVITQAGNVGYWDNVPK